MRTRPIQDVRALMDALGPDHFGPDFPTRTRWFRMTVREAQLTPPSRVADSGQLWLDRPPSKEAALLLFSDVPALLATESAALDFARALWAHQGRPGSPPDEVAWRVSGAGSVPSSYNHLDAPVLADLADLVPRGALGSGYTGAFAAVARFVEHREHAVVEAFLRTWMHGFGLWSVGDGHVALFAPERADTPVRWTDLATRKDRKRQIALNLQLMKACTHSSDVDALRIALESGADPDCVPPASWGYTDFSPLSALVRQGNAEMVRVLLEAGADPGATDAAGNNALARVAMGWAARDHQAALDGGFPIDARDVRGRTALHQVCRMGHDAAAQNLVRLGAEIDAVDADGVTPLQMALARGHTALLEPMLRAGADPHKVARDGRTLYHFLLQRPELSPQIRVLQEAGVVHRRDGYGWAADQMLPQGVSLPALPAEGAQIPDPLVEIPEGLAMPLLHWQKGGWEVLGDWLQEQGDPRGNLIAMALAEEQQRLPAGTLAREELRLRTTLLSPFRRAHPLGVKMEESSGASFFRGLLWRLHLDRTFHAALPQLLEPARHLLNTLVLDQPDPPSLAQLLPQRMLLRELFVTLSGAAELALPEAALPVLDSLTVRGPLGATLRARHPSLRQLSLESPALPEPWLQPAAELDLPALTRLRLAATREFFPQDPGWKWLQQLLERPPPALESLTLLPASGPLLEWLVDAPVMRQLRSLDLLGSTSAILPSLERCLPRLSSLTRLEVSVVDMRRTERQEAAKRLAQSLPQLKLTGSAPRGRGAFN